MKKDYKNLFEIGDKFGKFTVIQKPFRKDTGVSRNTKEWYVRCKCDCGKEIEKPVKHLLRKEHLSCYQCSLKNRKRGGKIKHGDSHSKFYEVWHGIKRRVCSSRDKDFDKYSKYGMYEPWKRYENFKNDLYEGFVAHEKEFPDDTQLDRIDGSKGYFPDNVRWVTCTENNRNKRTNTLIRCPDKVTRCVSEAEEKYNLPIKSRLHKGWSIDRIFNTPRRITKRTKAHHIVCSHVKA